MFTVGEEEKSQWMRFSCLLVARWCPLLPLVPVVLFVAVVVVVVVAMLLKTVVISRGSEYKEGNAVNLDTPN